MELGGAAAYVARAPNPTAAGVLIVPHVMGVEDSIRGIADALAERGLTTVAWNPYPHLPLGAKFSFKERPPRPEDDVALGGLIACLDAMETQLGLTTVGTVGFCMGGRFALLFAAREKRLRAAVAAYPSIPLLPSGEVDAAVREAPNIACPVQVLEPKHDIVTPPETYEVLSTELRSRSADTAVIFYPKAEHGFFHNPNPENDDAARRTLPQIHAFFAAHLSE